MPELEKRFSEQFYCNGVIISVDRETFLGFEMTSNSRDTSPTVSSGYDITFDIVANSLFLNTDYSKPTFSPLCLLHPYISTLMHMLL